MVLAPISFAFGWTYMCLWVHILVPGGCADMFWPFSKHFQTTKVFWERFFASNFIFWPVAEKTSFGLFYPLWRPKKCVLEAVDRASWVPLEPQICTEMAEKGP